MEKTETQTITTELYYHHFYCDHCGAHLGTSEEYDDGYYQRFGDFELKWYTPAGWYRQELCLCDECKEKHLSKIYSALEQLGFKKEN